MICMCINVIYSSICIAVFVGHVFRFKYKESDSKGKERMSVIQSSVNNGTNAGC